MRRPLAAAGLFFILILLIINLIHPAKAIDCSAADGRYVTLSGTVTRIEYKAKEHSITVTAYIGDIKEASSSGESYLPSIPANYTVLCYMAEGEITPELGTEVLIRGRIREFDRATNPGVFDAKRYYDIMHVATSARDVKITSVIFVPSSLKWRIRRALGHLRSNIGLLSDLCFSEDDSAMIRAMLLGDRSSLAPDTKSLYSRSGIAHILAISGLHISMLGMAFSSMLKKCRIPAGIASALSIALMILYGTMTGMAASALRAVIMFSLRMTAQIIHRTYDGATALVIAAVIILTGQPSYLFYPGFQFSFIAIGAVMFVEPALEDVFPKAVSGALSVNIATLPVYLSNYCCFPLLSLILNLYVIPLMSLLLVFALIALAGCALYIPLGNILAISVHLILRLYEYSCRISDMLPFFRFVSGKPSVVNITIYVLCISLILIFRKFQTKLQIIIHLAFACIMLTTVLRTGIDVTLIDVGQGDGIYITDNCGTDILIDGGSSDIDSVGRYRLSPYLTSQGVSELDAVFITHMDSDHYNGILELLSDDSIAGPHIKCLYLTSSTVKAGGDAYEILTEAARKAHTQVLTVSAGDEFSCGGTGFICLYPDTNCPGEDTNNESLVLDMEYNDIHFLFTGDLGGKGENDLTEKLPGYIKRSDVLILKVAHHGSKNSSYEEFLDISGPDIALISAGKDNSYGHPSPETTARFDKRGIPYFCTAECGALNVHIQGRSINVIPFIR